MGKRELTQSFENLNDSLFSLSWEPLRADLSQSGDLGYTMGNWMLVPPDTTYGNYVSIWKKNQAGVWKFVLDTGTSTPGWFKPGK